MNAPCTRHAFHIRKTEGWEKNPFNSMHDAVVSLRKRTPFYTSTLTIVAAVIRRRIHSKTLNQITEKKKQRIQVCEK